MRTSLLYQKTTQTVKVSQYLWFKLDLMNYVNGSWVSICMLEAWMTLIAGNN